MRQQLASWLLVPILAFTAFACTAPPATPPPTSPPALALASPPTPTMASPTPTPVGPLSSQAVALVHHYHMLLNFKDDPDFHLHKNLYVAVPVGSVNSLLRTGQSSITAQYKLPGKAVMYSIIASSPPASAPT